MLKGAVPDINIKRIHDNYVSSLINYFKMIDKKDILQEEYSELKTENRKANDNFNVDSVNNLLMEQNLLYSH